MKTIQAWRQERGWTQRQLAAAVNTTVVTVYNWERRRHEPTARQLRAIARALNVSMDEIDFEREEKRDAPDTP